MRVVVVGLGVQGQKRRAIAGSDVVATVDPVHLDADTKHINDVPTSDYDAVLLCVPDDAKPELLAQALSQGKHVLVEKPILALNNGMIEALSALSRDNGALLYTAYNHRFEPHFVRMRDLLTRKELGRIYSVRMFYGNGTARLVRESAWRDKGTGVLPDLGSHLLDTVLFWFNHLPKKFELWAANRFENRSFDHVAFGAQATPETPLIQLEMTLVSWRNHFYADVYGEKGSAHISSLCKWGPSSFIHRTRVLPAGRPEEDDVTLAEPDPTWALEYDHFKRLAEAADPAEGSNTDNDIAINSVLNDIARQAGVGTEA